MDTGAAHEPDDQLGEVREDCRHYSSRTLPTGETVRRCRLGANAEAPFACPEDCLFFEPRAISDTGWST